jgi:hypothetical protein
MQRVVPVLLESFFIGANTKHCHIVGDRANPVGLSISTRGEVTHAHRHVPQLRGKNSIVTAAKLRQEDNKFSFIYSFFY